jgi:DNA-binding transcriptional LysR family regulator
VSPQQLPAHQWLAFGRETPVEGPHDGFAAPGNPVLVAAARGVGRGALAGSQPSTMPLDMQGADGQRQRVNVEARIASNNQLSLQQMCEHGLGIARLGHADVAASLARGALVRVLPQWRFASLPVWVATPRRDAGEAAKVRLAVDHLRQHFAGLPARAIGDVGSA